MFEDSPHDIARKYKDSLEGTAFPLQDNEYRVLVEFITEQQMLNLKSKSDLTDDEKLRLADEEFVVGLTKIKVGDHKAFHDLGKTTVEKWGLSDTNSEPNGAHE